MDRSAAGPAAETTPTNQPPTAAITRTCTDHTCTFDSGDSTDPDDGIDGWAWTFGDGESRGNDPVVDHTYTGRTAPTP